MYCNCGVGIHTPEEHDGEMKAMGHLNPRIKPIGITIEVKPTDDELFIIYVKREITNHELWARTTHWTEGWQIGIFEEKLGPQFGHCGKWHKNEIDAWKEGLEIVQEIQKKKAEEEEKLHPTTIHRG